MDIRCWHCHSSPKLEKIKEDLMKYVELSGEKFLENSINIWLKLKTNSILINKLIIVDKKYCIHRHFYLKLQITISFMKLKFDYWA